MLIFICDISMIQSKIFEIVYYMINFNYVNCDFIVKYFVYIKYMDKKAYVYM